MAILDAARPFPVLGRSDDYQTANFEKVLEVDPQSFMIRVQNFRNLVNELFGDAVADFVVVENTSTCYRKFIPLEGDGIHEFALEAGQMLGVVSITIVQLAISEFATPEKPFPKHKDFDKFFQESISHMSVSFGDLLGFGETLFLEIDAGSNGSWITLSNSKAKDFSYKVDLGADGRVVAHMGQNLYSTVIRAMSEPNLRDWVELAVVKPALEFGIKDCLSAAVEQGSRPYWHEGLLARLSEVGISFEHDVEDVSELQRVAMQLLERELLQPLSEASLSLEE